MADQDPLIRADDANHRLRNAQEILGGTQMRSVGVRKNIDVCFQRLCMLVAMFSVLALFFMLAAIVFKAVAEPMMHPDAAQARVAATEKAKIKAEKARIKAENDSRRRQQSTAPEQSSESTGGDSLFGDDSLPVMTDEPGDESPTNAGESLFGDGDIPMLEDDDEPGQDLFGGDDLPMMEDDDQDIDAGFAGSGSSQDAPLDLFGDDVPMMMDDGEDAVATVSEDSSAPREIVEQLGPEKGPINDGFPFLQSKLLVNRASDDYREAGFFPSIWGSVVVCILCALFTLPIGVATAVFLEEFQPNHRVLRWLHGVIQLNISNLAGVPSVVYGILGLTAFAYMFHVFDEQKTPGPKPWYYCGLPLGEGEWEIGIYHYQQIVTLRNDTAFVPINDPNDDAWVVTS
ncbi:MAG: hypothetical protein AAFN70_10320, partial [Planctomycetota bacterium]